MKPAFLSASKSFSVGLENKANKFNFSMILTSNFDDFAYTSMIQSARMPVKCNHKK